MTTSTLIVEPLSKSIPEIATITAKREAEYRANPEAPSPHGPNATLKLRVTSMGQLDELVETPRNGRTWRISEPTFVGGRDNAPWS